MTPSQDISLSLEAYTVGWVCVLDCEQDAARVLLDEEHLTPPSPSDDNTYIVGRMGEHNVVIARPIKTGKAAAANAAVNMVRTFPKIRFGLMVGIGGGATDAPGPGVSTTDIFLGDVVVSQPHGDHGGILQYDMGKQEPGRYRIESHLNSPGALLTSAASRLGSDHKFKQGNMQRYIKDAISKFQDLEITHFGFPGREHDLLFAPGYHHANGAENCGNCDTAQLVNRTPRENPVVHYGLIASADTLMRDGELRDTMRRSRGVLCFEMEAAGLMDCFPCLAIRGIADYADSHKNDLWQPYAALTAAAYAKDLLALIQPRAIAETEVALKQLQEVKDGVDRINTVLDGSHRTEILNWITRLDFEHEQETLFQSCVPTGKWLIESEVFKRWVDGARWQLRCYGEAGTGKTHLCAVVVQHLRQKFPSVPVICIYLSDQADQRKEQTRANLLGSIVKQLLLFNDSIDIPVTLRNAYKNQLPRCERTLKEAFEELLGKYDRTYLIVDGFYQYSDDVPAILKEYPLALIRKGFGLSLLTTSPGYRQVARVISCNHCGKGKLNIFFHCHCDDNDFDLCLQCKEKGITCAHHHDGQETYDTVRLEVRAREGEIELFCRSKLTQASSTGPGQCDERQYPSPPYRASGVARYLCRRPGLIDGIAEKIARKAQGNFLVAQAWIQALLERDKEPENCEQLLADLDCMPFAVLNGYYNAKIENVKRYRTGRDIPLAFMTFCVIMSACRPITVLALQHALALANDLGVIRDSNLDHRVSILRATNGLITIDMADEGNSFVRFVHGTLWGVLAESDQDPSLKAAESKMAFLCLMYLKHDDFPEHSANIAAYPFLSYALEHWGDHVRRACSKHDHEVENEALEFLANPDHVRRVAREAAGLSPGMPSTWIHEGIDALHLCAWFDLPGIMNRLCNQGRDINMADSKHQRTPLRYACLKGHVDTVQMLVSKALVDDKAVLDAISGLPGTERSYREQEDRMAIVKILLKSRNLTLNAGLGQKKRTTLMRAVSLGYYDFVERLLEEPLIDVNIRDADGYTALWIAVTAYPAPLVPLQSHHGLVGLMLRRGADPNMRYQNKRTVLTHAVTMGQVDAVAALLECDRLELQSEKDPIHITSASGYPEIIRLLHSAMLDKGASDIDARDEHGLTPLHRASLSSSKHAGVVARTLLNLGADPNISDDRGCTPFTIAFLLGRTDIMQAIGGEEPSPDLEAKTLKDLPALTLAKHGYWSIIRELIIAGRPDLAHRDIVTGNTLLHIATSANQLDIMRMLLTSSKIRPVYDANNRGHTPLQLARSARRVDIAKLLVEYDCRINGDTSLGLTRRRLTGLPGGDVSLDMAVSTDTKDEEEEAFEDVFDNVRFSLFDLGISKATT
ncbi:hypothetical protein CNMCM5793_002345 [Aspergillus hiratsukae]|uniref:Nephrocystin 3-like N-terminal domain-containing protein n=1 Tax=Aspergillus hiratsukae TaxID=1194566 RepID=A0A8H6QG26_9EURO|nr:hypothetical protein CNMCM5793_002345 [Aspergillus hiratsukae]KAF7172313.1 hypothetical protein CNMCM6106_006555 [Aspergillus hiratsukae]